MLKDELTFFRFYFTPIACRTFDRPTLLEHREFGLMNYAKAKSYYEESIQLFGDIGDIARKSISSLMLAQLEKIIGNANQAIELAGTAAKELAKLRHPQADYADQIFRKMEENVINEK